MSVRRLLPNGRNLPDPHSGNILPQAMWAPATFGPTSAVPRSSVPAMYPPATMAQRSRTAAVAAYGFSPRTGGRVVPSSSAACERAFALIQSSRPSRSIAVPRCAATSSSARLCSTVSPPSPAWARTRTPAIRAPRKAQGLRSRRPLYARQQRSPIRITTIVASSRWENSITRFSLPTNGTTWPPQRGQPLVPLPPGPQPSPDSLTRTIPPTTISRRVTTAVRSARRRNRRSESPPPPATGPAMASGYRLFGLRRRGPDGLSAPYGITDVAQRLVAANVRDHVEVVRRRGRGGEPLEGLAAPRGVTSRGSALDTEVRIDDREDDAERQHERPDRRDQVERVEVHRVDRVTRLEELEDVDLLALDSGEEQRDEGELRAQHDQRGRGLRQPLAHRPAGHLREPVVERRQAAQDGAADQDVSAGGGGCRGVREQPVDGDDALDQLADQAEAQRRDRGEGEDHRRAHPQHASRDRADPVDEDRTDRDRERQRHQHRPVEPADRDRRAHHVLHPGQEAERHDRRQRDHQRAAGEHRLAGEDRQDL